MESIVKWVGGMAFQGHQDGHVIPMDASAEFGGQDGGARPKALLLTGLGGCTGMDVVSLLRKMRVDFEGLEIQVEAGVTEDHPKVFTSILVRYVFRGRDLPMDKLEKAVRMSQEKYCGVSAMLAQGCPIRHEIQVEA